MRSDDPYAGLTSSRRSRFYYTDMISDDPQLHRRLRERPGTGFYEHMFLEDLSHMLPWGRGIDDGFTAAVTSTDPRAGDIVRNALPSRYGPPRSLEDGLRQFIEDGAQRTALDAATYEIDYLRPPGEPDARPAGFRLEPLPPGSFDVLDGQPIQYVPAAASEHSTDDGLHYVRLDPDHLITICLDPTTQQVIRHALTLFAAADRQQMTPMSMLQRGQGTGFDFATYRTETARALLSGTHELGWTGRDLFADEMLAPYTVWRHLRFLRFKITIRDAILTALSVAVTRAGKLMNFEATVTIGGLATVADIDQAEADLETGQRPLRDLLDLGP